jgi:hypothetical protein
VRCLLGELPIENWMRDMSILTTNNDCSCSSLQTRPHDLFLTLHSPAWTVLFREISLDGEPFLLIQALVRLVFSAKVAFLGLEPSESSATKSTRAASDFLDGDPAQLNIYLARVHDVGAADGKLLALHSHASRSPRVSAGIYSTAKMHFGDPTSPAPSGSHSALPTDSGVRAEWSRTEGLG